MSCVNNAVLCIYVEMRHVFLPPGSALSIQNNNSETARRVKENWEDRSRGKWSKDSGTKGADGTTDSR